jgi:hypothetical protein
MAEAEMLAACGLDCGPCTIRRIPIDADAAETEIAWFKEMGWLQVNEGVAEAIEKKMYCSGCQGDRSTHWSADCAIMLCCVDEKQYRHCGECSELMGCETLEAFANDEHAHHRGAVERLRRRFGLREAKRNG